MVSESRLAVFGTYDNVRLNKSNVLFYPRTTATYSSSHTSMTHSFPLCERNPLAVRLFAILHNVTTSTHLVAPRHQIILQPCLLMMATYCL